MLTRQPNTLYIKAEAFSTRILKMSRYLRTKHAEAFMISQVARSGTSIGANISESRSAQSRADFVNKLNIALKEADETKYWLKQFYAVGHLSEAEYNSITDDVMELIYLLTAIIKKTKENGL